MTWSPIDTFNLIFDVDGMVVTIIFPKQFIYIRVKLMHHESLNFLWISTWVLELKKVIILVLNLVWTFTWVLQLKKLPSMSLI